MSRFISKWNGFKNINIAVDLVLYNGTIVAKLKVNAISPAGRPLAGIIESDVGEALSQGQHKVVKPANDKGKTP